MNEFQIQSERLVRKAMESAPSSIQESSRSSSTGNQVYIESNLVDLDASSDSEESCGNKGARPASVEGSETEQEALAGQDDTKMEAYLRVLVILLFLATSVAVPWAVHYKTRSTEVSAFHSSFYGMATKVLEGFEFQLARKLSAIDSFRISLTSHVVSTDSITWPFVTVPDFDLRAASTSDIADSLSVSLHPLITNDSRKDWETFSVENIDWLRQARERCFVTQSSDTLQQDNETRFLSDGGQYLGEDLPLFEHIFQIDDNSTDGRSIDMSDGPFLPMWQQYPPIEGVINYNILSDPFKSAAAIALIETGEAVITGVEKVEGWEESLVLHQYYSTLLRAEDHPSDTVLTDNPVAAMLYPIFGSFEETDRQVVGIFQTIISFKKMLSGILQPNTESVVCVIENTCGDTMSFLLNGENTFYLGPSDQHDSKFDDLEEFFEFWAVEDAKIFPRSDMRVNHDHCSYLVRVYPSNSLKKQFITTLPLLYSISMAVVVVFISMVSLTYDFYVQRRMKRVLKSAQESRAIVSSLFPANVRDRLFQEEEERKQRITTERPVSMGRRNSIESRRNSSGENSSRRNSNEREIGFTELFPFSTAMAGFAALAPPKMRLKFFLHEDPHRNPSQRYNSNNNTEESESDGADDLVLEAKPIADLFPHCTVLFADISGFTAWSSEREPEQVFTLLQTIFQTFDHLARKRDIFKVETIGDCYVAVTGLPDPQLDHAVRMAKFARACIQKVSEITSKLEVTLGPGTGDLRMRFGLHSGPVTAGVLRGEKSRFQLFGDTVNTASRMESTGQRNRIQVSQATAQLLIEAGKGNWIQAREDLVHAKGKGSIQTFWVLTARRTAVLHADTNAELSRSNHSILDTASDGYSDHGSVISGNGSVWGDDDSIDETNVLDLPPVAVRDQYSRLIEWQVDLLLRLLKNVVSGRDTRSSSKRIRDPNEVIKRGDTILDEMSECITLPKFDPKAAKARARPSAVHIPDIVIIELREYVTAIADRYRDNPFHNFAHASHVTMSANKLLSRIVKPEDVNYHRKSVKAIASDLHDYTYGITSDALTQFAVMFSALIHDVDHSGISNGELNKENPLLASKYNSRSVAEQNSVDVAWDILMDPAYQNLQQAIFSTEAELIRFRQLLVNMVLATDIFDKDMKTTRNMRWEKVFHTDNVAPEGNNEVSNLKATIVIEHIIQAADVAHTMQHWQVYKKWNERLFQEMYSAYESGRSSKDPSLGWYAGELWFFDNYVIPLARKLEECGVFGVASEECLNYALENRKEWAVKGKDVVNEMVDRFKATRGTVEGIIKSQHDEIVFNTTSPPTSPNPRFKEKRSPVPKMKSPRKNGYTAYVEACPQLDDSIITA